MKKVLTIIVAIIFLSSCASYYDRIIESDYSYGGKFNRYDSFDFMINQDSGVEGEQQQLVEKFIGQRLGNMGYSYTKKRPSLIVSYKIYYDDFYMNGYLQPNFAAWAETKLHDDVKIVKASNEADDSDTEDLKDYYTVTNNGSFIDIDDEEYGDLKCEMTEGTLLITFFDRRAKQTVWQGYASGVVARLSEERFLRHTVGKILDEYSILASGYGISN
ncbi:MAG: DUF4136 domain-containing protein [Bacteroidetes bacterium]|nr:DUF4136 domain-containing protein [Bacteroidota bacterium]MDA1121624.1 DUF4136 domain-containing protein [Bacteroidota bacterium]